MESEEFMMARYHGPSENSRSSTPASTLLFLPQNSDCSWNGWIKTPKSLPRRQRPRSGQALKTLNIRWGHHTAGLRGSGEMTAALFNRRRQTARPVVRKGHEVQSPWPHPISSPISSRADSCVPSTCRVRRSSRRRRLVSPIKTTSPAGLKNKPA